MEEVRALDLHSPGEALGWDCYYSHLELAFAWRSEVFMPGGQSFLIWASLSALLLGVLNSVRMSFMPTTLWQLGVYMAMIGIGGGLMFKGLKGGEGDDSQANPRSSGPDNTDVLQELAELRAKVDRMN